MKTDILSLSYDELKTEMEKIGEKKFRTDQIFSWLHEKKVSDFSLMTNLSNALRTKLSENFMIPKLKIEACQESQLDGTRKYLFLLEDGNLIESVLMRYEYGNSVCVSSQVGCRMGCRFCASTIDGLERNLRASEILSEVYEIEKDTGETVNHIVIMGSGEPMDNYDHVVRFIQLLSDPRGKNLSKRNVTLSTCGLTEGIRKLSEENMPVTLALSLHASDDETRKKLMPIANKYSIKEILEACDEYFHKTGRRVTYEYSVVRDVNDSEEEARKLGALLKGRNAHVNLIPVNPIAERNFEKPDMTRLLTFQKTLAKYGTSVTIRREMGADIDGACGQLRRRKMLEKKGDSES